jgi:hypothetical protein
MSLLFDFHLQKKVGRPDFKNQSETARCLFDFCEERAQVLGGLVGVWIAHLMFELPVWQFSITERTGPGQWLAEAVATFGLLLTIFGCVSRRPDSVPYAVGL